VTERVEWVSK